MRVLTVCVHPNPQSLTHAAMRELTRGLADGGHESQVVDLHAIGFDPVFRLQDYAQFPDSPIPGGAPKDVVEQQQKVAWAEGLVFITPIFWMGFPAILKGGIERVFAYGFAYSSTAEGWKGDLRGRIPRLKHGKALIISGTFFDERHYQQEGWGAAMTQSVDEWTFSNPGIANVGRVMFYAVNAADEATRRTYLDTARRLGRDFGNL
jgi:NAD(P)H dehydrogenase (quinone)